MGAEHLCRFVAHADKGNKGGGRKQKEGKKTPTTPIQKSLHDICCLQQKAPELRGWLRGELQKTRIWLRVDNQAETGRRGLEMSGGEMSAAPCQELAALEPSGAIGCLLGGEILEKQEINLMCWRGGISKRTIFLLLTPAERWLCTFPSSRRRLKDPAEATEERIRYDRSVSGLYSLKSAE